MYEWVYDKDGEVILVIKGDDYNRKHKKKYNPSKEEVKLRKEKLEFKNKKRKLEEEDV